MKKFDLSISDYDNCVCNICHNQGRVLKLKYYVSDYASNKCKGKICKRLQYHPRELRVCGKCANDFNRAWSGLTQERIDKEFGV